VTPVAMVVKSQYRWPILYQSRQGFLGLLQRAARLTAATVCDKFTYRLQKESRRWEEKSFPFNCYTFVEISREPNQDSVGVVIEESNIFGNTIQKQAQTKEVGTDKQLVADFDHFTPDEIPTAKEMPSK
jgi:hypothetical protein